MCDHKRFGSDCTVTRLTDFEDGPVTGFSADVRIRCLACGLPFEFVGLPCGWSPLRPMVRVGALEVSLPIRPSSGPAPQ